MRQFAADRHGATAIEYALIAAMLSVLILAGVSSVGVTLSGFFSSVASGLK